MLDPFDQKKKSILSEISSTNSDSPDASPKGTIDELCIPLIELINSNNDMVTTSSCSGRVSVFLEGVKNVSENDTKIGAKGNQGRWVFVTHNSNELNEWYSRVRLYFPKKDEEIDTPEKNINTRYILFKFEPLILHVKCRNQTSAIALYTTAMNCGFRESGIGSNNIVAIRISIKLDAPIGFLDDSDGEEKLISVVSEGYLKMLTKLADDRFKENAKKIDELYKAIGNMNSKVTAQPDKKETKEERRERKIKEGLERRGAVREQKDQKKKEKAEKAALEAKGRDVQDKAVTSP
ncbi:methyltransferase TYW3-domain-containing protein [Scheffersomyces xylosifermentans]|uniref:methyltransferase TYW3-domain-containing protein n=1 Tax=Scheffersomyces xylosifermentans TaxID=1304137 RepID=UPI00315CD0CF